MLGTVGRGRCGNKAQNREERVVLYDERAGMSGSAVADTAYVSRNRSSETRKKYF